MTVYTYDWARNHLYSGYTTRLLCLAVAFLMPLAFTAAVSGTDANTTQIQTVTPSHVFQITQKTINTLIPILRAKQLNNQLDSFYFHDRQPRHVWQKAHAALTKMQQLQKKEGLVRIDLPPLYLRDAAPADVIELIRLLHKSALGLREHYHNTASIKDVPLRHGKIPSDVYSNLTLINSMLDNLVGAPVIPSDVHQIVRSVNEALQQIYHQENTPIPPFTYPEVSGKTPRNVYILAHETHADLKAFHSRKLFDITGGIPLLTRKGGLITPRDVLHIARAILADLQAIGSIVGLADTIELAPYISGKTPSDVYAELLKTRTMIRGLK